MKFETFLVLCWFITLSRNCITFLTWKSSCWILMTLDDFPNHLIVITYYCSFYFYWEKENKLLPVKVDFSYCSVSKHKRCSQLRRKAALYCQNAISNCRPDLHKESCICRKTITKLMTTIINIIFFKSKL